MTRDAKPQRPCTEASEAGAPAFRSIVEPQKPRATAVGSCVCTLGHGAELGFRDEVSKTSATLVHYLGPDGGHLVGYAGLKSALRYKDGSNPWTKSLERASASDPSAKVHFVQVRVKQGGRRTVNALDAEGVLLFLRFCNTNKPTMVGRLAEFVQDRLPCVAAIGSACVPLPRKEPAWLEGIAEATRRFHPSALHRVGRRQIDLYYPTANLAVECDEHGHSGYDSEDERLRDAELSSALGTSFAVYRFAPEAPDITVFTVIADIVHILYTTEEKKRRAQEQAAERRPPRETDRARR